MPGAGKVRAMTRAFVQLGDRYINRAHVVHAYLSRTGHDSCSGYVRTWTVGVELVNGRKIEIRRFDDAAHAFAKKTIGTAHLRAGDAGARPR